MLSPEALGFIGGALSTGSLIPQLIRVIKLKSAREISLLFTSLLLAGVILWIIYGVYFQHPPIILWNSITVVLASGLIYAKLKYGK